jgi:hypothetical protein
MPYCHTAMNRSELIKDALIKSSLRGAAFSRERIVAGRGNPEFI